MSATDLSGKRVRMKARGSGGAERGAGVAMGGSQKAQVPYTGEGAIRRRSLARSAWTLAAAFALVAHLGLIGRARWRVG